LTRSETNTWRAVLPLTLVAGALVACAAALAHAELADAARAAQRWPGTTLADLERGREVYVARCSHCHVPRLPEAYPAAAWPALVAKMSNQAKLAPEDEQEITRFLVTTSARLRHEPMPDVPR